MSSTTVPPPPPARSETPVRVEVVVEVPRLGHVKRTASGEVDFVSPVPCPFNYGCVPDHPSGDGDPLDAVLLGPTRRPGHRQEVPVWGVVRFVDAGQADDKLVCSPHAPSRWERALVRGFFAVYGPAKQALNRLRGRPGPTRVLHLEWREVPA